MIAGYECVLELIDRQTDRQLIFVVRFVFGIANGCGLKVPIKIRKLKRL